MTAVGHAMLVGIGTCACGAAEVRLYLAPHRGPRAALACLPCLAQLRERLASFCPLPPKAQRKG